jgi:hypothetical protein
MTDDPIEQARAHLAIARALLGASQPRTDELRNRVLAFDRELEERDPVGAMYGLPSIISDLLELKARLSGTAAGGAKLEQDSTPVLLPGVADAIDRLRQAVETLQTWYS